MNALNIKLQDRVQLINKLYEHVCVFEVKFCLWVGQPKQCIYAHFLQVNLIYVVFVGQLREQFKTQFVDLRANNQAFALFATLFAVTVEC